MTHINIILNNSYANITKIIMLQLFLNQNKQIENISIICFKVNKVINIFMCVRLWNHNNILALPATCNQCRTARYGLPIFISFNNFSVQVCLFFKKNCARQIHPKGPIRDHNTKNTIF